MNKVADMDKREIKRAPLSNSAQMKNDEKRTRQSFTPPLDKDRQSHKRHQVQILSSRELRSLGIKFCKL